MKPDLDEIEKRCNAATPGPWIARDGDIEDQIGHIIAQAQSTPMLDGRTLFQSRPALLMAEAQAIMNEKPPYNKMWANRPPKESEL